MATEAELDAAIDYLVENPHRIYGAWPCYDEDDPDRPKHNKIAHCLFEYATPTGRPTQREDGKNCGCLTLIKNKYSYSRHAWTEELTEEILKDDRIPADVPRFQDEVETTPKENRREMFLGLKYWQMKFAQLWPAERGIAQKT